MTSNNEGNPTVESRFVADGVYPALDIFTDEDPYAC
jgi:hypothetical protein